MSEVIIEGHNHSLKDLQTTQPNATGFSETWYSNEYGFGHDCTKHQDVPENQWSPGCHDGGFRPVTVAVVIPPEVTIERAS